MEGMRVRRQQVGFAGGRLWQIAAVTASGAFGITSQSDAAVHYWQDAAPGTAQPAPQAPPRHSKTQRPGEKKSKVVGNESAKPQGPLIISISIAQQKLRLYDANGLFAEAPVSTGMPGHLTPMGVFSVIQKQKFHRSNIYSGAPMPFMQRITWSGIAMHAGVLPGHPASHGCIRMPMAFAVKLYNWTKMGARVVVTPGDITPAAFSHPLLATVKVLPQPVAAEEMKTDLAAVQRTEKPSDVEAKNTAPALADTKIELRSTVGHADDAKRAGNESHLWTSPQVQTADASSALPAASPSNVMSDAAPAGERMPRPTENAVADKQDVSEAAAEVSPTEPKATKPDETAALDEKPVNDKSAETQPAIAADSETKPVEAASDQVSKPETAVSEVVKPSDATAATIKRSSGQIAIFVSRKDSKLYVRQNFSPLFDVPVTIAADERPLGTHIFTAQVDSGDANVLHWSVVSLPAPGKSAARHGEEERSSRGRKLASAGPIEAKPLPIPDSPAEALNRLSLPAEIMARLYEAVSTGGSIIISDQGIAAGETGEGTDFIVSLR
jgi:lipoprotein-anchoring transpeptidase ErfK/SrfK